MTMALDPCGAIPTFRPLVTRHSTQTMFDRPVIHYTSTIQSATLALATFSWLITNLTVLSIHEEGTNLFPSTILLYLRPYVLSCIHLVSSAATLYLASCLQFQSSPRNATTTSQTYTWKSVRLQNIVAMAVSTLVLVVYVMTLPPLVLLALLVAACSCLTTVDTLITASLAISTWKTRLPALLSLCALVTYV
ncbi:hypothetical protein BCR44DRAFT_273757 [Catenaria anguillulae PL171]|uniref:Uncharacterized protein n=1 Tax=Catenaria anguillulae PL171 TaxID=765915 RepID=A0A1Y2HTR0_9FUNG|nr:hypothetical protein BCR44DRAFT_273757 [Catenaria anguillulae PL171]